MERKKINKDMLSGLPDEVLHHILSFLPTKLSVRTSVLAERWRFLWAHVPNLEFQGDDFSGEKTQKNNKHLNIIDRVLSMNEAKTLNTFSLIDVKGCPYRLETLIINALKRSVRILELDFGVVLDFEEDIACALPRLLFTCKTLVELKLDNCGMIRTFWKVSLPCLKKLDLSYVEYEDEASLERFLMGCPVIEELIVNDCVRAYENNVGLFIVTSPTIKTLQIHFSSRRELYHNEMLIIDLPALIYLEVSSCYLEYAESSEKTMMASLIEAKINVNGYWHDCVDIDCTEHGRSRAFLSSLCHVRYLQISSDFHETLADIVGTSLMPKFVNLTKLELKLNVDWHYLVKFLEFADNLEVLVFRSALKPYREPKRVPTCMLSRLRTVTINSFCYHDEGDLEVVRYILKNTRVLERMDLYGYPPCSSSNKGNLKIDSNRRILSFERGSKSCKITFNPPWLNLQRLYPSELE